MKDNLDKSTIGDMKTAANVEPGKKDISAGVAQENEEFLGLVSVIIPVYNIETYLTCCIQSVLDQSYPHFELILIDDGSTDGSPRICDEFAQKDSRVKVIHNQNQGPSATRNCGIEASKGDFIVFVDSDDLIQKDMLKKMVTAITRYKTDLAICGFERFSGNVSTQLCRLTTYSLTIFQSRKELASVYNLPATNMFGISIWAKMYRADIIRENNIRFRVDINYEEDCLFNLDYFRQVTTTAVLPDYFYRYRQMDVSLSKGYRKDSYKFLVNGYRARKVFLTELGMSTAGAGSILIVVVKNTLLKIFNSNLPKEEKLAEYKEVISFEESKAACKRALHSKNRLTKSLAKAVLSDKPNKIHNTLVTWSNIEKVKGFVKKSIGSAKKIIRRK